MQLHKKLFCCFLCFLTLEAIAFQKKITFEKKYEVAFFGDDNDQAIDIIREKKHILVSGWSYLDGSSNTLSAILRIDKKGKQVKALHLKGGNEKIVHMVTAPNDILYWFGIDEEAEKLIVTKVKQSTLTIEKRMYFTDYSNVYGHEDIYGFLNKDNQLTIAYHTDQFIQILTIGENLKVIHSEEVSLDKVEKEANWGLWSLLYEPASNQIVLAFSSQHSISKSTAIICKYTLGVKNSLHTFFESKLTFSPEHIIKTPTGYTLACTQRKSLYEHDNDMALIHISQTGKQSDYQSIESKKNDNIKYIIQSNKYTFLIGDTENFQHILSTDDKNKAWVDTGDSPVVIALDQSGHIVGRYMVDSKVNSFNEFENGILVSDNELILIGNSNRQWLISHLIIK